MGLTVLDAGVLIGVLDAEDAHHEAAHQAVTAAQDRRDRIALPASAFAECLVWPARRGPDELAKALEFVHRLPIDVAQLTEPIAAMASLVRARHGRRLRLPDALVVATARILEADVLVTSDRGWPPARDLGFDSRLVEL